MDPLDAERLRLERQLDALHRLMLVFLISAAAAVLILGVFLMTTVGGGREHLGGRLAVAVGALVLLGAIDRQATKVVNRKRPLLAPDPPGYGRFVTMSGVAFFLAVAVLLGVAILLP